jgi:hypothetical protein
VAFADKLYMARSWSLFAYIDGFPRSEVHHSPVMSCKLVEKHNVDFTKNKYKEWKILNS